jgi:hypothetical protein
VLGALLCAALANPILWLLGVSSWVMLAGSAASVLAAGAAAKSGVPARFAGR